MEADDDSINYTTLNDNDIASDIKLGKNISFLVRRFRAKILINKVFYFEVLILFSHSSRVFSKAF